MRHKTPVNKRAEDALDTVMQSVYRARRKSRRAWDAPSWGVWEEHLRHLTSWRDVADMVAALEPSESDPLRAHL